MSTTSAHATRPRHTMPASCEVLMVFQFEAILAMNYFLFDVMLNVSKQRSSDKNIVSHQIGVGTRDHELAIENNLQKRGYQLVCFFSSYRETAKSKAKNREFST